MRAVVYDAYGATPVLRDVPDPSAPPDGVVIRVVATGVCRSDWHAWAGHDPVALPHVPGHEFAGVIDEVGPGVSRWQAGQRVTVPFVCGCGRCEFCRAGETQVCPEQTQPGFTQWGSYAEKVVVHAADHNLVALPDDLDDVQAAALGCRFATAYRAVTVHGRLGPGQWLAVFGAGGVGLSALLIGRALGARVVAVDVDAGALDLARELGAEATLQVTPRTDPAWIAQEVRARAGSGVHVGLEAIGSTQAAIASVHSLRRRGRHVQAGLLFGDSVTPEIPLDRVIAHELSIHGTHGMPAADYPPMLQLVASGAVDLRSLVGRVITLEEAGEALMAMGRGGTGAPAPGVSVVDVRTSPRSPG